MIFTSGGLNIYSKKAEKYAEQMYMQISRRKTDCINVAKNSKFTMEQVTVIKNYLFKDCHELSYGYAPFTPSYDIAESWRRLSEKHGKNVQKHDLLLLYHELCEIKLVLDGVAQSEAHDIASKKYNYQSASEKFYGVKR